MDKKERQKITKKISNYITYTKLPDVRNMNVNAVFTLNKWIICYLCLNTNILLLIKNNKIELKDIIENLMKIYNKYNKYLCIRFKRYHFYKGNDYDYNFVQYIFDKRDIQIKMLLKDVNDYYQIYYPDLIFLFDDNIKNTDIYTYYHCSSICDLNVLSIVKKLI